MYLSLMGPQGLQEVAHLCRNKAYFARKLLTEGLAKTYPQIKVLEGECFNEVSLLVPQKHALWIDEVLGKAESAGMLAGLRNAVPRSSGFVEALTLAFTEKHTKEDIEALCQILIGSPEEASV
jgi:glycine dehydrogenase subunit 1